MVLQCCVPGCRNTSKEEKLHRFPYTDELVYNEWIKRIGNAELKILPPQEVYKKYRVCHLHFHEVCKIDPKYYSKSGLKKCSLPTVNLPGFTIAPTQENSFMTLDHYKLFAVSEVEPEASTSSAVEIETVQPGLNVNVTPELHSDLPSKSDANVSHQEVAIVAHSSPVSSRVNVRKTISRKNLRKNFQILKAAQLQKKVQLTPKAKRLYEVAKRMRRIVREVDTECESLKERLKKAEAFTTSPEYLKATLNKTTFDFVCSQIKQQPKKPKGRRFTDTEKIFAASLMKRSLKGYKLLEKVFALPSRKTLIQFLARIRYRVGINQQVMDCIEATAASLDENSKYCVLAFDEMMLEAGVAYSSSEDYICGFQSNSTTDFCDHVLVFMAMGVCKKWKQPIAYFFSKGGVGATKLKQYLTEVIIAIQNVGLHVVATVCDQFQANCKVYTDLIQDTHAKYIRQNTEFRGAGFEIQNEEIVPLFDPPHLLKGIRNNFLEYNVSYLYNGKRQVATWNDIVKLYEMDVGDDDTKMCNKLSDIHIYKDKIKKMKVSLAAQVFSRTVSAIMRGIITHGSTTLPRSALDTADFLLFFNKLFDSVNGTSLVGGLPGNLKCAATKDSPHLNFWPEAVKMLDNMYFIKSNGSKFIPPSLKNWKHTIKGFHYLWQKLQKAGVDYFPTRSCNQDALENFFGQVRSQGARNINPTCLSFVTSFKTLIINNFMSAHSVHSNCENDFFEGALSNLRALLKEEAATGAIVVEKDTPPPKKTIARMNAKHAYIAGFVCKKLKNYYQQCDICKQDLLSSVKLPEHILIDWKSYGRESLLYPTTAFSSLFCETWQYMTDIMPQYCGKDNIKKQLLNCALNNIHCSFHCEEHNLKAYFFDIVLAFFIHTWLKKINGILKGRFQNINTNSNTIAQLAHNRYLKFKTRKAKVNLIKQLV